MFLIVAVLLLIFLPSPWNLVGFLICLAAFIGELLFWNRKVRHQRHEVGPQTLIGRTARVVTRCSPEGQVRVDGELWAARCAGDADVDETVEVVGRDGLTLVVSRTTETADR